MHAGIQTTVRSTKKKKKNGLFVVTVSTPPACFLNETLDVTEFSHVDTQRKKKKCGSSQPNRGRAQNTACWLLLGNSG